MNKSIFIIECEQDILNILNFILTKQGYKVHAYSEGIKAINDLEIIKPDLILLDLTLPDISGLEVCRIIKNNPQTFDIPVIALAAKGDEYDIITGLNLGCDDYITKPFNNSIFVAKIKAALRREERKFINNNSTIRYNDLILNCENFEVYVENEKLNLSALEFKTLCFFLKNKGKIFTRGQILEAIRDNHYDAEDRSVDFLISRLRKKLNNYGKFIESVYGVGYGFKEGKEIKETIAAFS